MKIVSYIFFIVFFFVGTLIYILVGCSKLNEYPSAHKSYTGNASNMLSGQRFKDSLFSINSIDSIIDVPFRLISDFNAADTQKIQLNLDFYEPRRSIDTMLLRPLIIWMHGGGFEVNDKKDDRQTCLRFASRGYTVASINYRLNPSLTTKRQNNTVTTNELFVTIYRAIQDAKFAIRFAKSRAANVGVDTNRVFFAGLSAGGVTALHVAYLNDSEIAPNAISPSQIMELGNLDYGGSSFNASSKVKGIMVFAGSILDLNIIKQEDTIPAICLHSGIDNMLPIGCGDSVYYMLTTLCSGKEVSSRLRSLGIKTAFKLYDSIGIPIPYSAETYTHGSVVDQNGKGAISQMSFQFAVDSLKSFFKLN